MGTAKRQILLVDDDPSMLKMHGKRFELAGYGVITAADGEEAVAKARAHLPDVIVLDIELPKLDGFGVCQAIKRDPATTSIPILMFTAKGPPSESLAGQGLGADVYISKSALATALLEQVATLLERRPAQGP
jgi:DNA-binding response OmpR family regulator